MSPKTKHILVGALVGWLFAMWFPPTHLTSRLKGSSS